MTGALAMFEHVARSCPDATAVEDRGRSITYRALRSRAAEFARCIASTGASDAIVALQLPKSADYVAAVWGAWWAGAAFLPVDPRAPIARRREILAHSGATLVLEGLEDTAGPPIDPVSFDPERLAYLVYTSGSTGRPKGVAVNHRGLGPLVRSQIGLFALQPGDRALAFLSTAFDASISDLCTALGCGATLVIEDDDAMREPASLLEILAQRRITHFDVPPSLLARLDPDAMPSCVRTLIVGGEAIEPGLVRRWGRERRLVDVYGPTEATICSSACLCDPDRYRAPILGAPIEGTELRVIDGELYIGGEGVARGYWKDPELTATRFVWLDGARFFRTGDRVREVEGELEFLGRTDRQLKIHGQLVAPEEIEARLCAGTSIEEARVLVDCARLVAFVAPVGDWRADALRAHLATHLPAWLVPPVIVVLDRLPRTATDKIDPEALRLMLPRTDRSANDGLEGAFREVLGHDRFGPDDDFFAIGGDSLRALDLVAAADARGIALAAPDVFRLRTLAALRSARATEAMPASLLRPTFAAPASRGHSTRVRSMLLTGATGFLGSRVLCELLARDVDEIVCLVRAEDDAHARTRLERATGRPLDDRVHAVAGDLERPSMGLTLDNYARLASEIDCVVHCAAKVHVGLDYAALRGPNVDGTREALAFASSGVRKRFSYASTLSVFVSTDRAHGVLREEDDLAATRCVYGGYAQTKFAAEHLVRSAGLPDTRIVRLGLLTGDTMYGRFPAHDLFAMFCRGLVKLGCVPDSIDAALAVDVTPVDFAAAALAHLTLRDEAGVFHVANPRPLPAVELIAAIEREAGTLTKVGRDEFVARASSSAGASYLAMLRALAGGSRHRSIDLFQATGVTFDSARGDAALVEIGLRCPPADAELLRTYLSNLLSDRTTT